MQFLIAGFKYVIFPALDDEIESAHDSFILNYIEDRRGNTYITLLTNRLQQTSLMEANVFVHFEPDSGQMRYTHNFLNKCVYRTSSEDAQTFLSLSYHSGQKTKLIPIVKIGDMMRSFNVISAS